jgi:hypothetical protein
MVSRRWLSSAQIPPELRSSICSRVAVIDVTLLECQTDFACKFRGEALQPRQIPWNRSSAFRTRDRCSELQSSVDVAA